MDIHDLEFEEALPLLSTPAEQHDPLTLHRRRFIQGAVAAAAATAVPFAWADRAAAATPVGPDEGVLVVVFLGGGNDGLHMVAPRSGPHRGHYERLRGGLAHAPAALRPLDDGWGLHPVMEHLHRRYRQGQVAVVQGAGSPHTDLSHFTAMGTMMRGSTTDVSGWLGRYLDGVTESTSGMRGLTVGSSVPMYLQGRQAKVTAIPRGGTIWGADRRPAGEDALVAAVESFAAQPTGLGHWPDVVAASTKAAIDNASTVVRLFDPAITASGAAFDMILAARLINADLGARVVGVTMGGFDTHISQAGAHQALLTELDQAMEAFWATLAPNRRARTVMLVQSEFGRRPQANGSGGTDHGTANVQLLVGPGVRGGRHAEPPALDRLDDRGNVVPTVDFRAAYAQILDRWLGADSGEVLGGTFGGLDLFRAAPRL